jgi:putative methyltransferase (TIGR04325 family)
MKKLIFQLTPPLLINIYRKYRGKVNEKVFDGAYPHLISVPDLTEYDTKEALNTDRLDVFQEIEQYDSGQFLPASHIRSQITNLLPLLLASVSETGKKIILDYGGGMGSSYINCLKMLDSSIEFSYFIQDLPETMAVGRQIFNETRPEDHRVRFIEDFSELSNIDIVYLGSVIQYLPDYKNVLLSMIKKQPEFVLITDNFMGRHPTYATAQVNMPSRRMAYWIFELKEIVDFFSDNGYKLLYKSSNHQPFHNFNNFHEEYRVADSCNLLFRR